MPTAPARPNGGAIDAWCKVCSKQFSGPLQLSEHNTGRKHKEAVTKTRQPQRSQTAQRAHTVPPQARARPKPGKNRVVGWDKQGTKLVVGWSDDGVAPSAAWSEEWGDILAPNADWDTPTDAQQKRVAELKRIADKLCAMVREAGGTMPAHRMGEFYQTATEKKSVELAGRLKIFCEKTQELCGQELRFVRCAGPGTCGCMACQGDAHTLAGRRTTQLC